MDDFYQFMSPLEGATPPTFGATGADNASTSSASESAPTASSSSTAAAGASSRSSWSSWGASFNKLIERGKKDMNEFVEVTKKDLNELAQTVQHERSTAMESLTKRVEVIKTTLPPIPASVNSASADILGRMTHVVEGIKQEITEAATGLSSHPTTENGDTSSDSEAVPIEGEQSSDKDTSVDTERENAPTTAAGEDSTSPTSTSTSRAEMSAAALTFASTASLLSAGASTLSQTLTSSTKDIGTTANQLFKKTLPAVAEKHLGEADHFLKSTTETLKTNGLLAEQYVNKFGAGMANFLNNAVVISAPEEKEVASRSKKIL
jgi:hypothetical protein